MLALACVVQPWVWAEQKHLLLTTLLGQDVPHLALQFAGLNLVKMTLAGWKQQQVVVVELEVVLDLVEMVVEVVVLVEVLVVLVVVMVVEVVDQVAEQVVVKHRKNVMNHCPQKSLKISQGLFFPSSVLSMLFLGVAFSLS